MQQPGTVDLSKHFEKPGKMHLKAHGMVNFSQKIMPSTQVINDIENLNYDIKAAIAGN